MKRCILFSRNGYRHYRYWNIKQLLGLMQGIVINPSHLIRQSALCIVALVPEKDWAEAIYNWVKNNVRYAKDPVGIEMIQTPSRTIQLKQGDCDCQATLVAALLCALGFEVRFEVVQTKKYSHGYNHVFTEVNLGGEWVALDTTNKQSGYMGWRPETYKEPLYYDVHVPTPLEQAMFLALGVATVLGLFGRKT